MKIEVMKEIQVFKNELFGEIRTLTGERGEPWFAERTWLRHLDMQKTVTF